MAKLQNVIDDYSFIPHYLRSSTNPTINAKVE